MEGINGISVVICCYNSESRIEKVLTHLMDQEGDEGIAWEVIVVDNASTDATSRVARKTWKHGRVDMKVVSEMNPGLSHARRKGMGASRYEIISLVDDDNWVEKYWIRKIFDHMNSSPETGMMGGKGRAVFEDRAPEWFDRFQRSFAVGPQAEQSGWHYSFLYGAGLTLRKEAWNHLVDNGFKFILSDRKGASLSSGGDAELGMAILLAGYKVFYDASLDFAHFQPAGRMNWEYLVKLTVASAGP